MVVKRPWGQYLSFGMPSGRVHLAVETGTLCAFAAGGGYAATAGWLAPQDVAVFLGSYLFSSLLLSPDLDLARSDVSRRWGFARVLWLPYARIFQHRRTSHRMILGPLSRVIYLAGLCLVLAAVIYWITGRAMTLAWPGGRIVTALAAGVYTPNVLHVILDRLQTAARRRRRR